MGGVTTTTNTWSVVDVSGNHVYQNVLNGTSTPKSFDSVLFDQLGGSFNPQFRNVRRHLSRECHLSHNRQLHRRIAASLPPAPTPLTTLTPPTSTPAPTAGANASSNGPAPQPSSSPVPPKVPNPLIPNYSSSKSYLLDIVGTYDASNVPLTVVFTATEVRRFPANTQSYVVPSPPTRRRARDNIILASMIQWEPAAGR